MKSIFCTTRFQRVTDTQDARPTIVAILASLAVCASAGTIDLESPAGRISLDEKNGSVVALVPAGDGASVWRSDPSIGLWMTKDQTGHLEKAADFSSATDAAKCF